MSVIENVLNTDEIYNKYFKAITESDTLIHFDTVGDLTMPDSYTVIKKAMFLFRFKDEKLLVKINDLGKENESYDIIEDRAEIRDKLQKFDDSYSIVEITTGSSFDSLIKQMKAKKEIIGELNILSIDKIGKLFYNSEHRNELDQKKRMNSIGIGVL